MTVAQGIRWRSYFRNEKTEDITSRVADTWGFVAGFPVPTTPIPCWCGSEDLQIRAYNFWKHDKQPGWRYRCMVGLKCRACSGVRDFGVVITEEQFEARAQGHTAFLYDWRDAYKIMEKEGK